MIATNRIFEGIDIKGKSILDVGCGNGELMRSALLQGANICKGIEPNVNVTKSIWNIKDILLFPIRFQDYEMAANTIDVIVLKDSINHLDEESCITLHKNVTAIMRYKEIFNNT